MALFLVGLAWTAVHQRSRPVRQRLLQSTGSYRPTPGRLAGEVNYRPWRQLSPETLRGRRIPEGVLERSAARELGSSDRLDLSLFQLLSGNDSRAISTLEELAQQADSSLAALTDLSAAYLVRFAVEQDPIDLLRSVAAADRGLSLQPGDPALLFNRATALSLLGTRAEARLAWRRAEQGQSSDNPAYGWRAEARRRLQARDRPPGEPWNRSLAGFESTPVTSQQLVDFATRLPSQARAFGEEVLMPRWAAAVAHGDAGTAARALRAAVAIGDTLRRSRGEALLSDAVAALERTMNDGPATQRRALVAGLRAFGEGVVQYNEQNLASAKEPLSRAAQELEGAGNPLGLWARFYLAVCTYYADADAGLAALDKLLAEIPQGRYPALTGRAEWIAGTIDKVQGRIQSSVRRYERAAAALYHAGGDTASAFVAVLLAESYTLLGEHAQSWQARLRAFRSVPSTEGPRRNIAMWVEAKEALLRQDHLDLAGPLVAEAVASAQQWGRPLGLATAHLERASYWLAVGDRRGARLDLETAKRALAQMEESPLREQVNFSAFITEGLWYRQSDPARAALLLERGLEGQTGTGNRFEAITYTTAMAGALLDAGDLERGAAALERAIAIFEDIRATVEDPVSRMQAFRQAQPAFDRLIELRASSGDDARHAVFLLSERSRARVLLEMRAHDRLDATSVASLTEVERSLPPDTALVSFVALEKSILASVIEAGHSRLLTLPSRRGPVIEEIERFRSGMLGQAESKTLRLASARLYDALIRPLALAPARSLVVVPDRWLARLPFAALFDSQTGRFLIEQRIVTIAPSATLVIRRPRRTLADDRRELSILAAGVSGSGWHAGRFLPSLPFAEREARELGALYSKPTVLVGTAATRGNFLRMSVSKDVVHFAGHAVVDLDSPRRSVLLFAGAGAKALEPISLGELFEVGLGNAKLVVLSACRTQDSLANDREGVLGIAGAFFAAGVPEVVASPWDVNDQSAMPLMAAFHRHYRVSRSAGAAFRLAVVDLLKSGPAAEPSPASWGGFTVIAGGLDQGGG